MNSRYRRERRQPPYYLLTGLILGLLLGILISFVIFPAEYLNVPPETLTAQGKDQYRLMIASSYLVDQNLERAQARLGLLREDEMISVLENQASRSAVKADAQVLLDLVKALKTTPEANNAAAAATPQNTVVSTLPTTTPTLAATISPQESGTAIEQSVRTATPQTEITRTVVSTRQPTAVSNRNNAIPFVLSEQKTICNPSLTESLIQIEVFDKNGAPLSNTKIIVSWADGSSSFYTGYYPEISAGYADFTMTPPTNYLVKVGDIGEVVQNLIAPECEEDDLPYWGSLYLRFDAP